MTEKRSSFGSRFGTIAVLAGSAVGRNSVKLRQMRVSEGRANSFALPSGSILVQAKLGQLKVENGKLKIENWQTPQALCASSPNLGGQLFREFREIKEL